MVKVKSLHPLGNWKECTGVTLGFVEHELFNMAWLVGDET